MHDKPLRRWPLFLIAAPAAVAVWSGWVGLGEMCGFGIIHPLPGIWDAFRLNTAITLPIGVEAYGAYAMGAWLHQATSPGAKKFAKRSAIGSLALGMLGQVVFHLLNAAHHVKAPWPVVVLVSCLPVVTLGFGAALSHLLVNAKPAEKKVDPKRSAAAKAAHRRRKDASTPEPPAPQRRDPITVQTDNLFRDGAPPPEPRSMTREEAFETSRIPTINATW